MIRIHETRKTSKSSLEDVISKMPENVITNILDRLPLQDVVRTSILSTSWRYEWYLLSQLVFDYEFFRYLQLKNRDKCYVRIISRLLLHLITGGVITTFSLYIPDKSKLDDEDINYWLLFLSRTRNKNLTITDMRNDFQVDFRGYPNPPKLPTNFFSCLELKHLELPYCCVRLPPNFCGFPNLLSLNLYEVRFPSYECGEFLSQCPLLEILNFNYDEEPSCKVKLADITKLENLKTLDFSLSLVDDMTMINVSSILHHLCLLPKLQELTLGCWQCEFLDETIDIKQISTMFPCLKSLNLVEIDFRNDVMVSLAFGIIFGSPNLQTLKISAEYEDDVALPDICFTEVDSNTMGPLQLRNVVLESITGLENEVYMIKCILACSPMLKKFRIQPASSCEGGDQKMYKLASKLLKLHRASPEAEIDL